MITNDTLAMIKARVRELGALPPPKADVARMVIRSGDQLFLRAPLRSKLTKQQKDQLLYRFDPTMTDAGAGDDDDPSSGTADWTSASVRPVLAPIVAEFGYDIIKEPNGEARFQRFLATYEVALATMAPKGVRYRGTFVVHHTTEKTAGDYRTIWSFRSVGALNRIGDSLKANDAFGGLMQRFRSHVDDSPRAGRSQQVYQVAWGAIRGF